MFNTVNMQNSYSWCQPVCSDHNGYFVIPVNKYSN